MSCNSNKKPDFLTPGNTSCAIFCGLIGALIAVLFLTIGFWKTVFIAFMIGIRLFVGGVGDKKALIAGTANRVFPQKDLHPYKADDVKITRPEPEEEAGGEAEEAGEAAEENGNLTAETEEEAEEAPAEEASEAEEVTGDEPEKEPIDRF